MKNKAQAFSADKHQIDKIFIVKPYITLILHYKIPKYIPAYLYVFIKYLFLMQLDAYQLKESDRK